MNIAAEILKEYRVYVDGLGFPVRGRVVKSTSGDDEHNYFAEFSHECKPTEWAATVYSPSTTRRDQKSVEIMIIEYLNKFTTIDVQENERY